MSRIKIKNFGPIKDGMVDGDGFIDIKKVTIFIGDQGSGKSTVAKLISSLLEYEKMLYLGDKPMETPLTAAKWAEFVTDFHELTTLNERNTEISYFGEVYTLQTIDHEKGDFVISKAGNAYPTPKIAYIPSERNFFSSVAEAFTMRGLPLPLTNFGGELKRAQLSLMNVELLLPLDNFRYGYNISSNFSYLSGPQHQIPLRLASSGFQALVPLYLVSWDLALKSATDISFTVEKLSVEQSLRMDAEIAEVISIGSLSREEKEARIYNIKRKYINQCFINIVEEPEQNLFPSSQGAILNSLLHFNNMNADNKLLMTTHSPYIVNYLSIAIQGKSLLQKIEAAGRDDLKERLNAVVPLTSLIDGADVAIYQFDKEGTIRLLPNFEGIPSDKNFLNQALREGNDLFDSLLEIEEEL